MCQALVHRTTSPSKASRGIVNRVCPPSSLTKRFTGERCSYYYSWPTTNEEDMNPNDTMLEPPQGEPPKKKIAETKLCEVVETMCAQGFLRQATRLAVTSKEMGEIVPMGTGKQIYDAAVADNKSAIATYLAYWRGNKDSFKVLNWNSEVSSPLAEAASHNRLAIVGMLVAECPYVDVNAGPFPALCLAARRGYTEIVRSLVAAKGIDVNLIDVKGNAPLGYAASRGHAEVVRILVGVKAIDLDQRHVGTDTPTSLREFRELSNYTDSISEILPRGKTALELAIEGHHHEVVAIIEGAYAALLALDQANEDIYNAALNGDWIALEPLLKKWAGNEEVLNRYRSRLPLQAASRRGHLFVVKMLIATPGIDVNELDDSRYTALMHAAGYGHPAVVTFLLTVPGIDLFKKSTLSFDDDLDALAFARSTNPQFLPGLVDDEGTRHRTDQCAALLQAAMNPTAAAAIA